MLLESENCISITEHTGIIKAQITLRPTNTFASWFVHTDVMNEPFDFV